MKIEMLVSAVNQDVRALAKRMNIRTGAVIINQCGEFGYEEYRHNSHTIRCYSLKERGVGLSRNSALMRAGGEIAVFSDEDIIYDVSYAHLRAHEAGRNLVCRPLLEKKTRFLPRIKQ